MCKSLLCDGVRCLWGIICADSRIIVNQIHLWNCNTEVYKSLHLLRVTLRSPRTRRPHTEENPDPVSLWAQFELRHLEDQRPKRSWCWDLWTLLRRTGHYSPKVSFYMSTGLSRREYRGSHFVCWKLTVPENKPEGAKGTISLAQAKDTHTKEFVGMNQEWRY